MVAFSFVVGCRHAPAPRRRDLFPGCIIAATDSRCAARSMARPGKFRETVRRGVQALIVFPSIPRFDTSGRPRARPGLCVPSLPGLPEPVVRTSKAYAFGAAEVRTPL